MVQMWLRMERFCGGFCGGFFMTVWCSSSPQEFLAINCTGRTGARCSRQESWDERRTKATTIGHWAQNWEQSRSQTHKQVSSRPHHTPAASATTAREEITPGTSDVLLTIRYAHSLYEPSALTAATQRSAAARLTSASGS